MKTKIAIGIVAVAIIGVIILSSCASIPKNAEPVKQFDLNQYLGKWYEIARFDYKFEKNLNNVTAEYSLNDDGSLKVVNKGFNFKKDTWVTAVGKAKLRKDTSTAAFKVSFFGPFWSGYNVVAIDENYNYALVAGDNLDYLWILSRKPSIPEQVKNNFLLEAEKIGYDTSRLIWVEHSN